LGYEEEEEEEGGKIGGWIKGISGEYLRKREKRRQDRRRTSKCCGLYLTPC